MLFKNKNKKVYDFKYEIHWNNGSVSKGYVTNSKFAPFAYFSTGKCTYFNSNEIKQIEIFDLVEKVED